MSSIRIIGGQWRGRKLVVPDAVDLRPTPDRVRETVFNWLAPALPGAVCLDAFAGTGVLGFEALSRGAAFVTMVDSSYEVLHHLKQQQDRFKAMNIKLYQAKLPVGLCIPEQPFDIVFLDPPYQSELLLPTCMYLEAHQCLAKNALIYLESDKNIGQIDLPSTWTLIKAKKAGQVYYHLAQKMA